jgi:F0F1-type ATP synthase assembly protein I
MKNLNQYLRSDTKESSMRLMSNRVATTACFISIFSVVGTTVGIILAIILNRDLVVFSGIIGTFLGAVAGIVGVLLVPAFGGKAAQKFAEKESNIKKEDQAQ